MRWSVFALVLSLGACGGGGDGPGMVDAGGGSDAGQGGGLPATCTGACQEVTVEVSFGDAAGDFDRAFYGVTAEDGTLHIEAHAGGVDGCPTETSPSPERTLVIGSVPAPSSQAPLSQDDGVSVALLDFSGDILTGAPVASASEEVITPVAAALSAAGGGFIAFELSASFDGGSAAGRVYATHCDSMDQ